MCQLNVFLWWFSSLKGFLRCLRLSLFFFKQLLNDSSWNLDSAWCGAEIEAWHLGLDVLEKIWNFASFRGWSATALLRSGEVVDDFLYSLFKHQTKHFETFKNSQLPTNQIQYKISSLIVVGLWILIKALSRVSCPGASLLEIGRMLTNNIPLKDLQAATYEQSVPPWI